MPMFYNSLAVLNANDHSNLKLVAQRKYSYAAKANSVPVLLGELPALLPHYPVVFTTGEEPMLVALLGLRQDENLYVDEKGDWLEGTYVPAYVRRYPFILARVDDGNNMVLSADVHPDVLGPEGIDLFQNGQPTDAARDAFRFCADFQKAWEETGVFCKEVRAAGLLKDQTCTLQPPTGAAIRLTGFCAVDEEALDGLDNHTANNWRKKHLLKYLYLHLASMNRIGNFAALSDKRRVSDYQAAASQAAPAV